MHCFYELKRRTNTNVSGFIATTACFRITDAWNGKAHQHELSTANKQEKGAGTFVLQGNSQLVRNTHKWRAEEEMRILVLSTCFYKLRRLRAERAMQSNTDILARTLYS